jgi:hypothetical protein
MATNFFRTFVNDRSFIRGAARLLCAPIEQAFPSKISDVVALAPAAGANDVQTISETGPPTAGNFTITLDAYTSGVIAYNATAAAVQAALVAMPNIGAGNVVCSGGPLPGTPVVCTFQGALASTTMSSLTTNSGGLTGGTAAATHTTLGSPALALYDSQPGWLDLGATKNGITISINNSEDTFDIDQQLGIIGSQPSGWTVTVATSLAESTPERMQIAWLGSAISLDNTPTSGAEQVIGFGAPNFYVQRRLAVLFQRPSGKIRGYFFRIAQRAPQESTLSHNKTGDQQSIPVTFNALQDNAVTDVQSQFFVIRDQSVTVPVYN